MLSDNDVTLANPGVVDIIVLFKAALSDVAKGGHETEAQFMQRGANELQRPN